MNEPTIIIRKVETDKQTIYQPYLKFNGKWPWNKYTRAIISTENGFISTEVVSTFSSLESDGFLTHEEAINHAVKYIKWVQQSLRKPVVTTISEHSIQELLLRDIINE